MRLVVEDTELKIVKNSSVINPNKISDKKLDAISSGKQSSTNRRKSTFVIPSAGLGLTERPTVVKKK